MMNSEQQLRFGDDKRDKLPGKCRKCEYLPVCHGGCPKHRIIDIKDGYKKLNYLCKGYQSFFSHARPYMDFMIAELENNRAPANVMEWAMKR